MQNGIVLFHCPVPPSSVFAFFLGVVFRGQQISAKQLQSVTQIVPVGLMGAEKHWQGTRDLPWCASGSVQQLQGFTCPAGARSKGLLLPSGALREAFAAE